MLGVGEKLPEFKVVGVKPKFNRHEENGESAFETVTNESFPGKWKVIFFYPKDFTFVCPTEIAEFARLNPQFLHGMAQDVAADRLDNVLHEFRAVALQTRPLFRGVCAHVGDGGTAELILPDAGPYVGQPPPGRERNEQHA